MAEREKLQLPERERANADHLREDREKLDKGLAHERERKAELAQENKNELEQSKQEALEKAKPVESAAEKQEKQVSPAEKRHNRLHGVKPGSDAAFKLEMNEARKAMSAPSRTFSKFIHNKAVEKTSEAVGSTIARPNAMLAGSLFALILTAAIYFWARWAGYPLSGFETIGAFIIGWLVGIIFDFTRIMITGKQ